MVTWRDWRETLVEEALLLYIEGGSKNNKALRSDCQKGFKVFLNKVDSSLVKRLGIILCGSGSQACNDFDKRLRSLKNGQCAFLLVDSEGAVSPNIVSPWTFLCSREKERLQKPQGASDEQCHLMVQMTESWFLADRRALSEYFESGFAVKHLPGTEADIESIPQERINEGLKKATENSKKGRYRKGSHCSEILQKIDPNKVMKSSPWAKRFIDTLLNVTSGAAQA